MFNPPGQGEIIGLKTFYKGIGNGCRGQDGGINFQYIMLFKKKADFFQGLSPEPDQLRGSDRLPVIQEFKLNDISLWHGKHIYRYGYQFSVLRQSVQIKAPVPPLRFPW